MGATRLEIDMAEGKLCCQTATCTSASTARACVTDLVCTSSPRTEHATMATGDEESNMDEALSCILMVQNMTVRIYFFCDLYFLLFIPFLFDLLFWCTVTYTWNNCEVFEQFIYLLTMHIRIGFSLNLFLIKIKF